jgi:hypothetical protein
MAPGEASASGAAAMAGSSGGSWERLEEGTKRIKRMTRTRVGKALVFLMGGIPTARLAGGGAWSRKGEGGMWQNLGIWRRPLFRPPRLK